MDGRADRRTLVKILTDSSFTILRREDFISRDNERRTIEESLKEKVEKNYRENLNVPFTWKRLAMETFLIGIKIHPFFMYYIFSN